MGVRKGKEEGWSELLVSVHVHVCTPTCTHVCDWATRIAQTRWQCFERRLKTQQGTESMLVRTTVSPGPHSVLPSMSLCPDCLLAESMNPSPVACACVGTPCGTVGERAEEQEALHTASSNWENRPMRQDPLTLGGATFCDLVLGIFYTESQLSANRYLLNAYCIHYCRG